MIRLSRVYIIQTLYKQRKTAEINYHMLLVSDTEKHNFPV